MRMPKETLVEERVDPREDVLRQDVLIATPLVRNLPAIVPPNLVPQSLLPQSITLPSISMPDVRGVLARLPRMAAEGTLGFMRENGLAPLAGLLARSPLIGWALAVQLIVSGVFGLLVFGIEPMLVSGLAFVLSLLVVNTAATRLEREGEGGGET